MNVPEKLLYSSDHEWALVTGSRATVGITDYAQDALGDVVYVELPELGAQLSQGEIMGEVESTKSVSELYSPVSGTVIEINEDLFGAPQRLNEDPYGSGWICVVTVDDTSELGSLLDAPAYTALIGD